MATLKILPIKVRSGYSTHHGQQGDEAPNQTFMVGTLISPDANGKFQATPAGASAATARNRVAMSFGQNVAVPTRRVEYQDPHRFGTLEVTAGGTAATAALIKVGATYGLGFDAATGLHFLNLSDTTNVVFRIEDTQLVRGVLGADTNVRVVATIVSTAR
jgi:hypothetical protein